MRVQRGMRPFNVRAYAPCIRYVLIAATCAAAAAACGSASSPGGVSRPAAPKVSLNITVTAAPGSPAQHWTLTCDPAGGTHPDPAAACAELQRVQGGPFAPQPKGIECPMILASSKAATFQGTYFGQPVNTTIRDGGCTLNRWAQLGQVIN
jgi:Subtilisin inhibitor-like